MSIRSLRAAASFLTVLPVANADGSAGTRLGRAYFPMIGAAIGLVAGGLLVAVEAVSTPLLGAAAGVATLAALTGAIHLDGLADSADGLLSRGDAQRRLEVMRDPRLGSYGVTAIVVTLLLQAAALAGMSPSRALVALVVAGAWSRLAALVVVAVVPYVRGDGLGMLAADPKRRRLDIGVGVATALMVSLLDWPRAAAAAAGVALVTVAVAAVSRRRLGGVTGDVCGASAELGQLAALLAFSVR
jgi:adenosylcobinamide-GDP ribazoletransferase